MTWFGKHIPSTLDELQGNINRMFDQLWHSGIKTKPFDGQDVSIPVDLVDRGDSFVLECEIPGIDGKDMELTFLSNAIVIRGQKLASASHEEPNHAVFSERLFGSFSRTLQLPQEVRSDEITAQLRHGLLTIIAPKKEPTSNPAVKISIHEEDHATSDPTAIQRNG